MPKVKYEIHSNIRDWKIHWKPQEVRKLSFLLEHMIYTLAKMPAMKQKEKVLTLSQQGSLFPLLTALERAVFFSPKVLQLLRQHKCIPLIFWFFCYREKKSPLLWIVKSTTLFCSPHLFEAFLFAGIFFLSLTEKLQTIFMVSLIEAVIFSSYNIIMSVECTQSCAKHEFFHSYILLTLQIIPKFSFR